MGKELVEMNEVEKALSHNLREVREKKGYTLKDVVKGTGYTEVLESDRNSHPKASRINQSESDRNSQS